MIELVSELYIEVYWLLYRLFKNGKTAAFIDALVLIILQLINIYSIIKLVQKLTGTNFTGFIFSKPSIVIAICAIITGFNFFIGREAKKELKVDDKSRFVKQRFFPYAIISIALFFIALLALGHSPNS